MHIILLPLGLVISLAGIVLIGFGVHRDGLGAGDTLVVLGAIAIVGGLVLIGLASAIRQLRRIAQLLEARPLPRALGPEPLAPTVSAAAPATSGVAAPVVDVAPVLPPEPRIAASDRPARMERPAATEAPSVPAPDKPESKTAAVPVEEPLAEPSPPTAPPPHALDAIRPGEPLDAGRAAYSAVAAAVIETPRPEQQHAEPAPPEPQVRIFKSGVIDGMAYTLYTDGSIEAELAEGTVKFASIDELRAYLASRES